MANQIITVKYNELQEKIPTLTAGNYDLTVDCTGVDNPTLKGFGTILKTAKDGVFFNIIPTNIGETITDTISMFSECKNLTSIDTSNFLNVTNATNMFAYCDNLEKVIWGGSFRPTTNKDMFYKINKLINITASIDSERWIGDNAVSMSLLNYNLSYNFDLFKFRLDELNIKTAELKKDRDYWKKASESGGARELNIKYSELDTELPKLEPYNTYNLTIDTTGVDPREFVGNIKTNEVSPLEKKLSTAKKNIRFNLTLSIPETVTNATACFLPAIDSELGIPSESNLVSINITNKTLNISNADYMFAGCNNLKSIDTSGFTNVTNTTGMFANCSSLTSIDTAVFKNVTNASGMFQNCSSLTNIIWGEGLVPNTFDGMFTGCSQTIAIESKDWFSKKFITKNAASMGLNYTIDSNVYEKPDINNIPISYVKYQLYDYDKVGTYNLTIDCAGVGYLEFMGGYASPASLFAQKLINVPSGVYFNLTLTNIGSDVTNTYNMFKGCISLTSIDTSGFTNVTDATAMFDGCSNLTSITWKKWLPTSYSSMFANCPQEITIEVDWFTRKFITDNHTSMSLEKYKLIGGEEKPKPSGNIKYSELGTEMTLYEPRQEPYNLTIDCTGVASDEFVGRYNGMGYLSPFKNKLNKLSSGVLFNLTLTKLPSYVTDMSYMMYNGCPMITFSIKGTNNIENTVNMFGNCSSLISIDTSELTKVTNAGYMFSGCSNLTSITWGENFLPDNCSDMFFRCSQHIDIDAKSWYANTYIKNNASNMSLTNYTFVNEYPKPDIPIVESLHYNDLTPKYMMLYDPRPEPYNLTIDCTDVPASEFVGTRNAAANPSASPFGKKLQTAKSGVYFNLKPINVGSDVTNARMMFPNCNYLTSIDTTAFTNVTDASYMFYECSSLTSIDTVGFTNVTNASYMFYDCSSLTNIKWGDEFRPNGNFSYMFLGITASKVITASADSKAWIDANAEAMSLTNYTVNVV